MPSPTVRISSTCEGDPSKRTCRSRRIPVVIASAMISAATPAATPATEIAVITPTTACRRLARRYRAAMKSSKRMKLIRAFHCRYLPEHYRSTWLFRQEQPLTCKVQLVHATVKTLLPHDCLRRSRVGEAVEDAQG